MDTRKDSHPYALRSLRHDSNFSGQSADCFRTVHAYGEGRKFAREDMQHFLKMIKITKFFCEKSNQINT